MKLDKATKCYFFLAGVSCGAYSLAVAFAWIDFLGYTAGIATLSSPIKIFLGLATCIFLPLVCILGCFIILVYLAKWIKKIFALEEKELRNVVFLALKLKKTDDMYNKMIIKVFNRYLFHQNKESNDRPA